MNISPAEADAIRAQTAKATEQMLSVGAPFALLVAGVILGFAMRRKDLDEKFRVVPLVVCAAVAVLVFVAHLTSAGTANG